MHTPKPTLNPKPLAGLSELCRLELWWSVVNTASGLEAMHALRELVVVECPSMPLGLIVLFQGLEAALYDWEPCHKCPHAHH